jgi:M6 family metalloprotease-like protein
VRLLAIFLVALFAAGFVAPARAQAAEHKNLVVVVRFSDDATEPYNATYGYNSYYTCWQQFKSWFSPTNIPYFDNGTTSLSSYMSTISNGAYSVASYFPQSSASYTDTNPDNTNTDKTVSGKIVSYITLPHDKSYYESAGDLQLVEDAAAIFNANAAWTAGSSSWGSNGTLENLELVVQVAEEPATSDALLWPHKSNASGAASFGGMKVYEYNMVNSKAVGDLGTAKHEYLHSAGLGDLYRVGDTSDAAGPVGVWDIMGSAAGQFPLAQSLVDIGFEDASAIKTISATGTTSVTLHAHYSTTDDGQAVKVYSPYSADEYFVFEYRKKDPDSLAPDRMMPSSGLIVYRVNDAVDRDVNGHRTNRNNENGYYEDALYVFRPGETGIHDSAGNLQMAALNDGSATYSYLGNVANARTTFGSADMTKTITDGAIVDSSDKNSGIVVTVTAQTDNSITFDLAIPDYTALSLWDSVGTTASATQADCVSTAADAAGNIYQSFVDTNDNTGTQKICVRSWNGTSWTSLGFVATGALGHAQLQYVNSTLYCCYSYFPGSGNAYRIAKWTGATWTQVASVSTGGSNTNAPASAVIGNTLYALVDKDSQNLQLYKLTSTSLSAVGGTLGVGYVTEAKLGSVNGSPAVVCGDVGTSFSAKTGENVYVYDGSTWSRKFSETKGTAGNLATASIGTSLLTFVAYDSGMTPQLRLVASNGTVMSYEFTAAGTNISDAAMFVSGSYAYLTTVDGNGLVVTWYAPASDLSTWKQLGEATMSNGSTGPESLSSFASGTKAYVGAISSNLTSISLLSHDLFATAKTSTSISLAQTWKATYTGSAIAYGGAVAVTGTDGKTVTSPAVTFSYSSTQGGTYDKTAPKNAGEWWVKASYAGNDSYAASETPTGTAFTIEAATPTITLASKTIAHTGSAITLDAPTVTGVTGGSNPSGTVTTTYYTDSTCTTKTTAANSGAASDGAAPVNVGTYYAKAAIAADGNYAAATSNAARLDITAGVPAAPSDLTLKAGNAQVALSWTVPSDTGGSEVTSYEIYRKSGSGDYTKVGTTTAATASYTDSGLVNGTVYSYCVKAVNANGAGAASASADARPNSPTTTTLASGWSTTYTGSPIAYGGDATVRDSSDVAIAEAAVTYSYSSSKDGTFSGTAPTEAGTWWVRGAYGGSGTYASSTSDAVSFVIKATATVEVAHGWSSTYTGSAIAFGGSVTVRDYAGGTVAGAETTLSYGDSASGTFSSTPPTNAGTHYVRATYAGDAGHVPAESATTSFEIARADISAASLLGLSGPFAYTGSEVKATPTVKMGTSTLKLGTDYALSYANDMNAGTATVTATGRGNYTGAKSASYAIAKAATTTALAAGWKTTYTGSPIAYGGKATVTSAGTALSGAKVSYAYSRSAVGPFASTPPSGSGTWYVRGTYAGDANHAASASAAVAFLVVSPYRADVLGAGSGKAFTIRTRRAADRLVDISGRSLANGGNAQMWHGNETPAQRFYVSFTKVEGSLGYYTVRNVCSGKVLDVAGGSSRSGANVQQWDSNGTKAQQWAAADADGDGYFTLTNVGSGKVLDIAGNSAADGANLQQCDANGTSAQDFRLDACELSGIGTGTSHVFAIHNVRNSSRVVDVRGNSSANGANVWLYDDNGTPAQRFWLSYDAKTGYYTIHNKGNGKVIDVAGAAVANGSNIQQYSSNGTDAQHWSIKKNANGSYTLYCACNGRCFDVQGARTDNGTNIWCWDANGTSAQQWTFQAA